MRRNLMIKQSLLRLVLGVLIFYTMYIVLSLIGNGFLLFLKSTDLSNIRVDCAAINNKIDKLNLKKYTESDRYSGDYKYLFDEICIDVDEDNVITSMHSRFDEDKTQISINDVSNLNTIDEVENILGENYYDSIYDSEQLLYSYVYYDRGNNIIAEFVYFNFDELSENNRLLTWINIYKVRKTHLF